MNISTPGGVAKGTTGRYQVSVVCRSPWIHLDDIFLWWPKVAREGLSMMTW